MKTRNDRGYGAEHRTVRAQYARLVAAGQAVCAHCGLPIDPNEGFDSTTHLIGAVGSARATSGATERPRHAKQRPSGRAKER
jgi:hypothetical protein